MTGNKQPPTLAEVQRDHPGWVIWEFPPHHAWYARRASITHRNGWQLRAETLASMADQIRAAGQHPDLELPVQPQPPSRDSPPPASNRRPAPDERSPDAARLLAACDPRAARPPGPHRP
jgi:hypothetical protein